MTAGSLTYQNIVNASRKARVLGQLEGISNLLDAVEVLIAKHADELGAEATALMMKLCLEAAAAQLVSVQAPPSRGSS